MIATIAIIDDDDAVRDSMLALLVSYDYETHGYISAEDFLSQPRVKADCLLVDQNMPGMTGLNLIGNLRAEGDQTPALMVTGCSDPTLVARAELIGIKVLQKPEVMEQLVRCIEETRRTDT